MSGGPVGNGHQPPAGPTHPPRQVEVFAVREEVRIQHTDLAERGGPVDDGSPTARLHLCDLEVVTVVLAEVELHPL